MKDREQKEEDWFLHISIVFIVFSEEETTSSIVALDLRNDHTIYTVIHYTHYTGLLGTIAE